MHDSRSSIEGRYKNYDDYRAQFQEAVDELVRERYILAEDGPELLGNSQKEWNWVQGYWVRLATE
jgi:hypothetical protein